MPIDISVIIVTLNYGQFLEEAIVSVLDQCDESMLLPSGKKIELILVDGGSNDNSIEIIKRYDGRIAWWCSEPDSGQSHAFNKGFSKARGRFLTWLNADDVFFPNALEFAAWEIERYPDTEWFVGGSFWLDPQLKVIKCTEARRFSLRRAKEGIIPTWAPSSFFSSDLLQRAGGVDERFHYSMDSELWHRFYFRHGITYRPIKRCYWGLRLHPIAKMSGHNFSDSDHVAKNHPKWKQIKRESEIYLTEYGKFKRSRLTRWLTTPPYAYLKSRLLTKRYQGKHYKNVKV